VVALVFYASLCEQALGGAGGRSVLVQDIVVLHSKFEKTAEKFKKELDNLP